MRYQVPQHIDSNKVFLVNRSEIEKRLDPNPYHNERINAIKKIKKAGNYLPLSSVVFFKNFTTTEIKPGDVYVGLENIISDTGEYVETTEKQSISSAAEFEKGDILFPKLRPYLNKVFYASFDGLCSTEFHVLKSNVVDAQYLSIFLRSSLVVNQTKHLMTGNTLPRLQTEDIRSLLIPIPSADNQRKIVDCYIYANNYRLQKEQEAQSILDSIDTYVLDELGIKFPDFNSSLSNRIFIINRKDLDKRIDPYYSQNYFREAFAVLNSCKYPVVNLRNISDLITSGITPKSGGDAYTIDKEIGVPFIRSGNISINGELDYDDLLYLKPEIHETIMKSSQLKKNDILIAIVGATIGQVGIYLQDGEANINQAIALVRLKDGNDVQFIKELIKSSVGQLSLNRLKRPVARANINLEEISTIKVILPPIEKQKEIASHIFELRQKAKALQQEGRLQLEKAKQEVEQMIIG
jgi:type I restriction enzyme S subunit